MREKRGSMYLLTGLILGLAFGLVYSWVIAPVKYINAAPKSLRADFKSQYMSLVAAAYVSSGDIERARARLNELGEADIAQAVAMEAQRALAEGRPGNEASTLGALAAALGQGPASAATPLLPAVAPTLQATQTQSPTPVINAQTELPATPTGSATQPTQVGQTAVPTNTLLPTRTLTPTAGPPFALLDMSLVCDLEKDYPQIQVETQDAAGEPVPGVEFIVNWEGGENHFFTGLMPEFGLGYADFNMTPGVTYTVRLADGGNPSPDLIAAECEETTGERYWGSWRLIYAQP